MSETALVTIQQTQALEVFTAGAMIDPILAEITRQAKDFTPDLTTAKGRKEIASMAHKVAQSKTYLDGIGKKLTDEYKEIPKKIDANRKKIRDYLDNLKDEIRAPLTEWEEAEKVRVAALHTRMTVLQALAIIPSGATSISIAEAITQAEQTVIDDTWEEFAADAAVERDKVLAILRPALSARQRDEAEQAELQRLREEAAKREQEERDRRIAEEAAARAKAEAEAKAEADRKAAEEKSRREREELERRELEARLAAERAEKERIEAIERVAREKADAEARAERDRLAAIEQAEREKQAAIEAERKRIEDEQRAKAEEERLRSEDEARRFAVHRQIVSDMAALGFSKDIALAIINGIRDGKIGNVSISY